MTRGELLRRMSATEREQWRIFLATEPLGDARMDAHFSRLLATLVNLLTASKGARKKAADYMKDFEFWPVANRVQSEDDMLKAMIETTLAMKGKVSPRLLEWYRENYGDSSGQLPVPIRG